jgi:hypothetical protein
MIFATATLMNINSKVERAFINDGLYVLFTNGKSLVLSGGNFWKSVRARHLREIKGKEVTSFTIDDSNLNFHTSDGNISIQVNIRQPLYTSFLDDQGFLIEGLLSPGSGL